MRTAVFSSKIEGLLDEMGVHLCSGQEYKLRGNYADFRFSALKGDRDKGYMKLLICEGFMQQGYAKVEFVQTADDRQLMQSSTGYEYFTAKVSYR
jgi:hypothetical protein